MRALNLGSPRPVSSSALLVSRLFLLLVFLIPLFGGDGGCAQARSFPQYEELYKTEEKIYAGESSAEATSEISHLKDVPVQQEQALERRIERVKSEPDVVAYQAENEDSVAKKRRRTDVNLPGKSEIQEEIAVHGGLVQGVISDQGIRRFDAQIEPDDADVDAKKLLNSDLGSPDQVKMKVSEGTVVNDKKNHRRRLIQDTVTMVSHESEDSTDVDEARQKRKENILLSSFEKRNVKEAKEAGEDGLLLEEEAQRKMKYKSTVYLNAEEEKGPSGVEESIVDDQIKKLISIRNDALHSVSRDKDRKNSDKLEEATVLNGGGKPSVVKDEDNSEFEGDRNQRSSDGIDISSISSSISSSSSSSGSGSSSSNGSNSIGNSNSNITGSSSSGSLLPSENLDNMRMAPKSISRLEIWKEEAAKLQSQIRDKTIFQQLREQAIDLLPDIPKFTENQLLETLRSIVNSKELNGLTNESYASALDKSLLTKNQMDIIECAEQLVAPKQRYDFISSVANCIRGLSAWNCMRVYIWPAIIENVSPAIAERLPNLPIEITLSDLFPGNREKLPKAAGTRARQRLLTPETIVYSILKDAMDAGFADNRLPTYIDPKNETLRKLLTPGRLEILQMAEKLLPAALRREYSDKMYSCVQRFEYFSCVKYFAWPLVRKYLPGLPEFPEYQSWYPTITLYPEYPLVPFPNFSEQIGQLPEVIDADDTRTRKPQPATIIVHILQNTLKEMSKAAPPLSSLKTTPLVTVIPQEQLLSIQMAEQLLPAPYRSEFVHKAIRCIRDYDYMTCIKYTTWPTLRQFAPGLPEFPDISGWIPDFSVPEFSFPNFSDYIPDFSDYIPELPTSFPDLSGYLPGNGPDAAPEVSAAAAAANGDQSPPVKKQQQIERRNQSNVLEAKVTEILRNIGNPLKRGSEVPSVTLGGSVVVLTTITEEQVNILRLAENIVPPVERPRFVIQVVSCLQETDDFINCTQYVVWPFLGLFVENLPVFPSAVPPAETASNSEKTKNISDSSAPSEERIERIGGAANSAESLRVSSKSSMRIDMDSKFETEEKINVPVISVTGTRFVPIFTEQPEVVILNILRSIQLSSPLNNNPIQLSKSPEFINLLNQQQETIIRITESLLPENIRPNFVNRMIDCVRENNFLVCSRDILWPTLTEYFPRIPNFPNFGAMSSTLLNRSNLTSQSLPENLTEPSSPSADSKILSETNVMKTGEHGDTTVTITDTRFVPIFSDHPEAVIYNILRAVQLSTPDLPMAPVDTKTWESSKLFTEHQINIIQAAEALLPENARVEFNRKIIACGRNAVFLDCSRDTIWPTVSRYYPRLPNFPNFGNTQNIARNKLDESSLPNTLEQEEKPGNMLSNGTQQKTGRISMESMELKIESLLKKGLGENWQIRNEHSYLDTSNPVVAALLTNKQANIIKLAESGMPDPVRPTFIARMLECIRTDNLMSCTQRIGWPTLKQFIPAFPDFPNFADYTSQLPGIPQVPNFEDQLPIVPQIPQIPQIPTTGAIFENTQIPNFSQSDNSFVKPSNSKVSESQQSQAQAQAQAQAQSRSREKAESNPRIESEVDIGSGAQAQSEKKRVDSETQAQKQSAPLKSAGPFSSLEPERETSANTPSVENQGEIPGYPGQPAGIFIDISRERVNLPEDMKSSLLIEKRSKRDTIDLSSSRADDNIATEIPETFEAFPNFTESEFLQLLVNVSKSRIIYPVVTRNEEYFVDTLDASIRKSLTADQYEILKRTEDIVPESSARGLLQQVVACIRSLSFIRCVGIFVWPWISSNLPSIFPSFGRTFGRSLDNEVREYFGISVGEFEIQLLAKKKAIESSLIDWYRMLSESKFQEDIGFLRVKGYGNGEIGIRLLGGREGKASKIKDNKNLPSILTIISDIMEEVLDQRPDSDRKRDKDKREKSIRNFYDSLYSSDQYPRETHGKTSYDVERSVNDDKIISMFIEKIKANATDYANGDVKQYLSSSDPYKAFEVLFGTRLNNKLIERLKNIGEKHLRSFVSNRPENQAQAKTIDVPPLPLEANKKTGEKDDDGFEKKHRPLEYAIQKEFSVDRRKGEKNAFGKDAINEYFKAKTPDSMKHHSNGTELHLQLPKLDEDIISRKTTNALIHLGRSMKNKMIHMMPGISFIVSFLIQMALAHARAAANVAGFLSNMALGSAMIGMIRNMMFGPSTHPKIKYVYDNDNMGPGVIWPQQGYGGNYYGK